MHCPKKRKTEKLKLKTYLAAVFSFHLSVFSLFGMFRLNKEPPDEQQAEQKDQGDDDNFD